MANLPAEILIFDYLTERTNALGPDDVLYDTVLHDTVYQSMNKTDRVIRISDAVGDFSPGPEMVIKEWDVLLVLVIASRVKGTAKTERQPALVDVFEMQQAVYEIILADTTLGTRVCDTLIERGSRGYDALDGEPFAVANLPLIINPSGSRFRQ